MENPVEDIVDFINMNIMSLETEDTVKFTKYLEENFTITRKEE